MLIDLQEVRWRVGLNVNTKKLIYHKKILNMDDNNVERADSSVV